MGGLGGHFLAILYHSLRDRYKLLLVSHSHNFRALVKELVVQKLNHLYSLFSSYLQTFLCVQSSQLAETSLAVPQGHQVIKSTR